MKMEVVLTKKEFEAAILAALHVYEKAEINSLYLRADGGLEFGVWTKEEPVHSSRSPTGEYTAAPFRMELWTPDPPPFIHSVEPTEEQAAEQAGQRRPRDGWWPPHTGLEMSSPKPCACGANFYVTEKHGWVHDGTLHALHGCEEAEVEERPWKDVDSDWWPPLPLAGQDTEKLVAVQCACKKFGVYAEHGWVRNGNLHRPERCEGEAQVEATPPAISDAAALSASSTSEHGTVESSDEDRIPF